MIKNLKEIINFMLGIEKCDICGGELSAWSWDRVVCENCGKAFD